MTNETVAGRKRQTVQTAHHLAECSGKWRLLRQAMSDDRLMTDGTAGCAAAARTTTADGDDRQARYRNEPPQDTLVQEV